MQELFKAIDTGNEEEVSSLFNKYPWMLKDEFINGHDDSGRTPLLRAIYHKRPNIVRLLLEKGADPDTSGKDSSPPLYFALSLLDQQESVKALLNGGANLHATLLYSKNKKPDEKKKGENEEIKQEIIVNSLLSCNFIYGEEGDSLLHRLIREGHYEDAILLLEHGANPNAVDKKGFTLLHEVASQIQGRRINSIKVKLIQELIKKGADVSLKSSSGQKSFECIENKDAQDKFKALLGLLPLEKNESEILQKVDNEVYTEKKNTENAKLLNDDKGKDREIPKEVKVKTETVEKVKIENPLITRILGSLQNLESEVTEAFIQALNNPERSQHPSYNAYLEDLRILLSTLNAKKLLTEKVLQALLEIKPEDYTRFSTIKEILTSLKDIETSKNLQILSSDAIVHLARRGDNDKVNTFVNFAWENKDNILLNRDIFIKLSKTPEICPILKQELEAELTAATKDNQILVHPPTSIESKIKKIEESFEELRQELLKNCEQEINDLRKEFVDKAIDLSIYNTMDAPGVSLVPADLRITFMVPGYVNYKNELTTTTKDNVTFIGVSTKEHSKITYEVKDETGTMLMHHYQEIPIEKFLHENSYTGKFMERLEKENAISDLKTMLTENNPETTDKRKTSIQVFEDVTKFIKKNLTYQRIDKEGNQLNTIADLLSSHRSGFWAKLNKILSYFTKHRQEEPKESKKTVSLGDNRHSFHFKQTKSEKKILEPLKNFTENIERKSSPSAGR